MPDKVLRRYSFSIFGRKVYPGNQKKAHRKILVESLRAHRNVVFYAQTTGLLNLAFKEKTDRSL